MSLGQNEAKKASKFKFEERSKFLEKEVSRTDKEVDNVGVHLSSGVPSYGYGYST